MLEMAKQTVAHNLYDVIVKPVITEKSTYLSANNQVVFKVQKTATKTLVKQAVKEIFGVDVEAVNIINQKGKKKRFRGFIGKRDDSKKAIVTIKEGQTIDVSSGIK